MMRATPSRSGLWGPLVPLLILTFAAFMTRLLPLAISQYPFNNDSITESLMSAEILGRGHLVSSSDAHWSGTHTALTPVLNVLLAFFAGALGTTPLECAQLLGALVSMATVGGIYLLGQLVTGSTRGAICAAFMAVVFGTFVFTTGSVWKEMLGLPLTVIALVAYLKRESIEFRALAFVLLLIVPFTHHLVAAVTFLTFAILLVWSLYHAATRATLKRSSLLDIVTVSVPAMVTAIYYSIVGFDSMIQISSTFSLLLIVVGFVAMIILSILVLSIRNHVKRSFAPYLGVVLGGLIMLDFLGFVFPYDPSATDAYVLLGLSSAFLFALAWFGAEIVLEKRPTYRAVQLALLLAPLTILGFGAIQGSTLVGQKILYRSFDFLDFFLFLGAGAAIVELHSRRKRLYPVVGVVLLACLLLTFPFSYASQSLLGVRHDTQAYEMDALDWLGTQPEATSIVSDERVAYLARSVLGLQKDSALPQYIATETPFPSYLWFYVIEDSWTSAGVNNYPYGKLVVDQAYYDTMLEAADLCYIGGPANDNLVVFMASPIGSNTVYGPMSE